MTNEVFVEFLYFLFFSPEVMSNKHFLSADARLIGN